MIPYAELLGQILTLVLKLLDLNEKGHLDQGKLDLIVAALKPPPEPKKGDQDDGPR